MAGESLSQAEMYDLQKTYNVYKASDVGKLLGGAVSTETLVEIFDVSPNEK